MLNRFHWAMAFLLLPHGAHAVELSPQSCSAPVVEPEALRYAMSGTSTLAFSVDGDGRAQQGRIARSSGYALLDQSALRMLATCRFPRSAAGPGATLEVNFPLPEQARTDAPPLMLPQTCLRPYKVLAVSDTTGDAYDLSVRVQIWQDGQPFSPKIERSSSEPLADQAALDMVEHCRFRPATRDARSVPSAAVVRLSLRSALFAEAALRARYEELAERIRNEPTFQIRHILVATSEAAVAIVDKLKAGGDFRELAQHVSLDTTSNRIGGDLGWIGRRDVDSELSNALKKYGKPGLLPAPVKSRSGWHVVEIRDMRPGSPPPYNDETRRILREFVMREREVVVQAPPQRAGKAD